MALQSSGAISLNDMHTEVGGTSGTLASINDADIRGLIGKASGAQNSFSEYYGASSGTELTSGGTVNGQAQRKEITVSSFISAGGTLTIPSNIWVWSDSTSTPALTIDIACTIINEGKIIGKGGAGGTIDDGGDGGSAIKINSGVTGVTIENKSGAYIAGGGGGGAGGGNVFSPTFWLSARGGGGGAGGGPGGNGNSNSVPTTGGTGGSLNASGTTATAANGATGVGGTAGGAGGSAGSDLFNGGFPGGGGGGRILPGSTAVAPNGLSTNTPDGGDGGGTNTAGEDGDGFGGGGGGGWGAAGGDSNAGTGGAGGAAVDDSGVTYTLTNNGTAYGTT